MNPIFGFLSKHQILVKQQYGLQKISAMHALLELKTLTYFWIS